MINPFKQRNKRIESEHRLDEASSIEVIALKNEAHKTAEQTKRDIDRLNRLLKANGITLKIHIATGGKH